MGLTQAQLRTYCQANGWTDDTSGGLTALDQFICDVHEWLGRARKWKFYKNTGYLTLTAPYETGTATLVEAATSVEGSSSVTFAAGMAGQEFYTTDDTERVYQIATYTDADSLVLASPYLGDGGAGLTYEIRYVRYAAATGLWTAGPFFGQDGRELGYGRMEKEDWDQTRMTHRATATTVTDIVCENGYFYVHPAPATAEQVRYAFWVRPATVTASVSSDWPDEFRGLILRALRVQMACWNREAGMLSMENGLLDADLDQAFRASQRTDAPIPVNPQGGRDRRQTLGSIGSHMTFS